MSEPTNREVAVLSEALALLPARRAAYLDGACAGDPALRQQVEELLRAYPAAEQFLESPPASPDSANTILAAVPLTEKPGDKIGHYKLLQKIGEGGCGVVYMAEQEKPVRRRVALKVIKLGMDTRQVIARFEAERQVLALMDHPNIARVFDAGATAAGRPYFAMELVRGIPITDYCDGAHLSTRQRLDLFIDVCQAIQHAHQKGVIHRDIKPSNILLTVNDGVAVPKVIDFGIAKATNHQPLTDKTLFTAFEQFIGTPAYMSPEQALMTSLDVDTRSDIYALGVLLYELLTGQTPFSAKALWAAGLEEMRRTIREQEPVRPSTRLSTMQERELTTTAKHHDTDARKLVHMLCGDLDCVVMKAMEKDRSRRYQTANGLAMDVQRYLADEPVVARPPSKLYRLQKLARRNKLTFAAAGAVLVALVTGLVAASWFFIQEKEALQRAVAAEKQEARLRQQAQNAEKHARAINRFLTEDLLFQATPENNPREKKVTMEEVLEASARRLDQNAEIAQQPELEATLRLDIGTTYKKLGTLGAAESNLRRAFTLRHAALGPEHLDTLVTEYELAELLAGQRKHEQSEVLAFAVWQGRLRLLGAEHRDTLNAQELYEEALAEQGKLDEAEPIARQIYQIRERALGADDPATISSLGDLGELVQMHGDNVRAEPLLKETLVRLQRNGLADTQNGFLCAKELAMTRLLQGDPAGAETLLEDALARAKKRLGPDHFLTLQLQRILVRVLAEAERLGEAEALGRETLDARLRTRANQDEIGTARTLLYLGRVLVQEGKLEEAAPPLQEALTIFRQDASLKSRPELAAQAANWLATIEVARKAYAQAEALMLPGLEVFFAARAELSPNERRIAISHFIQLYQAWDRPKEVAAWEAKLVQLAQSQHTP